MPQPSKVDGGGAYLQYQFTPDDQDQSTLRGHSESKDRSTIYPTQNKIIGLGGGNWTNMIKGYEWNDYSSVEANGFICLKDIKCTLPCMIVKCLELTILNE